MAQDSQSDKGGFSGICMQFKLTIYPMFTSRHQGVLNYSLNTKTVRGWEFSPSLLHWQGSLLHWQGLASSKYNAKQCRAVVFEIPLPPPPTPLSLGAACCNCNRYQLRPGLRFPQPLWGAYHYQRRDLALSLGKSLLCRLEKVAKPTRKWMEPRIPVTTN